VAGRQRVAQTCFTRSAVPPSDAGVPIGRQAHAVDTQSVRGSVDPSTDGSPDPATVRADEFSAAHSGVLMHAGGTDSVLYVCAWPVIESACGRSDAEEPSIRHRC